MSNLPPHNASLRKLLFRFAAIILILTLAYVLSIGPMYWQWEEAMMTGDNDKLLWFYLPLMVASEYCPPFRHVLNDYIELWAYS